MVQLASLSSTAPITSLHVPFSSPSLPKPPALLAAGRASELVVLSLDRRSSSASSVQNQTWSWKVLERERVHRIISRELEDGAGWQLLLSGGKEAALVSLSYRAINDSGDLSLDLRILHRFVLDDWVQDVAFLETSSYLFLTSHNTLLHYATSNLPSSPSNNPPPTLHVVKKIHCPLRPLLWCGAFSRSSYSKDDVTNGELKMAGGSMLGDVLSWEVSGEQLEGEGEVTLDAECVQKLQGHHGAIFSVSFSPSSRYLLSGSDDRTVRVWDLQASAKAGGEPLRLTMWGHEGRVWRVRWLDKDAESGKARVISVAEDSSCNIWSLALPTSPPAASPPEPTYSLLKSYQNGHDGKSMWSVTSGSFPSAEAGEEQKVVFTGGADGSVRSWLVPSSTKPSDGQGEKKADGSGFLAFLEPLGIIKAFTVKVDPRSGKQEDLLLNAEGALYHASIMPSSPPSPPQLLFSSPSLRNPSLLHLHFPSSTSDAPDSTAEAWVFTNRGQAILVSFSLSEEGEKSVKVQEMEIGVAAVSLRVDEGERRVALTERKDGGRVVLVEMSNEEGIKLGASFAFDGPAFATPRERLVTATNFLPPPPYLASTSVLLLGTSLGSLILASLPSASPSPSQALATARKVLADGVTDVALLSGWSEVDNGWTCEVESVGRDGVRALVRVSCSADGQDWSMKVVGQQKMTKGILDQILPHPPFPSPSLDDASHQRRYLALQDANAAVLAESGMKLLSFLSPGNSVPRAFVEDASGTHYYRIVHGKIHHQLAPFPSTSLPPSILLPSLHGREIRCVALHRAQVAGREVILVATGAENAVLKISLLHPSSHALLPVFTDSSIPSALKSVSWSSSPSGLFLFASGAGEVLLVSRVDVSSAPASEAGVRVNVRPWAQANAITSAEEEKEKGQLRVMDMVVRPLPVVAEQDERHLVLTGWSDGKLRIYLFDPLARSLLLTAESSDYGKCVLTVKLLEVDGRWLAVRGASDGLLAITEFTSLVVDTFLSAPASVALLPSSLFSYHPHQSGINGLDIYYSPADRALTVATAGDDNAVCVRRTVLSLTSSGALAWEEHFTTLPRAHGSTIQGLHFLSPSLLCSTAVDQRLNVYRLDSDEGGAPKLAFAAATCLGVADCSAMDVLADTSEAGASAEVEGDALRGWTVVSVGIGVEVTRIQL